MKIPFVALACAFRTLMFAGVPPACNAQAPEARAELVSVADSLFTAMDAARALALLRAHIENDPDDFDALWREARVAVVLSITTENRDDKLALLRTAVAAADRLLALRPGDPVALMWAASAKGRFAMEVRNPVTTTRTAKEVWTLTESLLTQQPDNAIGNGIRGKFIQEVRKLSLAERIFARLLLGGDIAGSVTWQESERYLARAVASDPKMVVYHLDLGDTYRLQDKDAEAMTEYRRGLSLPSRYPVDDYYKRRIRDGVRALEERAATGS